MCATKKRKAEKKVNPREKTKRNELKLSIFWNFIFLSIFFVCVVVVVGVDGVFIYTLYI